MWFPDVGTYPDLLTINIPVQLSWNLSEQRKHFFLLLPSSIASLGTTTSNISSFNPLLPLGPHISWLCNPWLLYSGFPHWILQLDFPMSLSLQFSLCCSSLSAVKGLKNLHYSRFQKTFLGCFSAQSHWHVRVWTSALVTFTYEIALVNLQPKAGHIQYRSNRVFCVLCRGGSPMLKLSPLLWCHQHLFFTLTDSSLTYFLSPSCQMSVLIPFVFKP